MQNLRIHGGYNNFDPIRDAIIADSRIGYDADPSVSQYCSIVYTKGLQVLNQTQSESESISQSITRTITPAIEYETSNGSIGYIWIQGLFERTDNNTQYDISNLFLLACGVDNSSQAHCLIMLSEHAIECSVGDDFKPGTQAELNFAWSVIEKIQTSMQPNKTSKDETARRDNDNEKTRLARMALSKLDSD